MYRINPKKEQQNPFQIENLELVIPSTLKTQNYFVLEVRITIRDFFKLQFSSCSLTITCLARSLSSSACSRSLRSASQSD